MIRPIAIALALSPLLATLPAQSTPPPSEAKPFICTGTAALSQVPWGTRYSYLLQGTAEFDPNGRLLPPPLNQLETWTLSLADPLTRTTTTLALERIEPEDAPVFQFPPTTLSEWESLGQAPTDEATVYLTGQGVTNGLFLALRNPQFPASQPLFQVVHFLGSDLSIQSEASVCFVDENPSPIDASASGLIPFETVQRGAYSGFEDPVESAVTTRRDFANLWQLLYANRDPVPPLPNINMNQNSLIVVALGDRPDGSYSVEIEQIRREDDTVVVEYTERRRCGPSTSAIVQPFHIVRIDGTLDSRPVFRRRLDAPECR